MGIKKLNQYFLSNCSKRSIKHLHFSELLGKTLVIDISIYMYKFLSDSCYMESLYSFLSILKYYRINPIFVFDGKPPVEKNDLLKQRSKEKYEAKQKYYEIIDSVGDTEDNHKQLETLRKKMVRLKKSHIENTKELITAFGFSYCEAPKEADQLCAYFVIKGFAYACLSDDCDMFLMGCPKVIRNLSILKHSAVMYDTESILQELEFTQSEFLEVMVLTGTDYNMSEKISLSKTITLHKEYKGQEMQDIVSNGFYEWLKNRELITNSETFTQCCYLFNFQNCKNELDEFIASYQLEEIKKADINKIKDIMQQYNFIFV